MRREIMNEGMAMYVKPFTYIMAMMVLFSSDN
jgi:hypothetical protein